MDRITVNLINEPDLNLAIIGARTCYDSFSPDNTKEKDLNLLHNLKKLEHLSIFEHTVFTFAINGISRLCLQELTRHRIASYSVQSTRYTLKKLFKKIEDVENEISIRDFVKHFCVVPEFENTELEFIYIKQTYEQLKTIEELSRLGYKNDELKYFLPESFRTELIWTINLRSLMNFIKLRYSSKAHFEIRHLAQLVLDCILEYDMEIYNLLITQDDKIKKLLVYCIKCGKMFNTFENVKEIRCPNCESKECEILEKF